jgi:O-antigen/teichoic acid export membrane protein
MLGALLGAALQASGRFTLRAAFRVLCPMLTLSALAAFATAGRLTPLTAAIAFVIPPVPLHLWLTFHIVRGSTRTTRSGPVLRPLLRYGLGAYGTDLIATLSTQLDRVLVVAVLSPEAAGLYAVGISVARLLEVAAAAAVTVVFPKACERPASEIVELVGRVARCAGLVGLVMAVAVAAVAPVGLRMLYGPAFLPVLAFLPILLLDAVLGSVVLVLTQAFLASGRPFVVTLAQGVSAGTSLVLFVLLVPRYGLTGASVAMLLSTALRFTFVLLSFGFALRSPAPGLVPTRSDVRALVRMFLRPPPSPAT